MFGKRGSAEEVVRQPPQRAGGDKPSARADKPSAPPPPASKPQSVPPAPKPAAAAPQAAPAPVKPASGQGPTLAVDNRSDHYYQVKTMIFSALIDTIDLAQLGQLDVDSAREEIRDIVNEIITIKSVVMSIAEQEQLLT